MPPIDPPFINYLMSIFRIISNNKHQTKNLQPLILYIMSIEPPLLAKANEAEMLVINLNKFKDTRYEV